MISLLEELLQRELDAFYRAVYLRHTIALKAPPACAEPTSPIRFVPRERALAPPPRVSEYEIRVFAYGRYR